VAVVAAGFGDGFAAKNHHAAAARTTTDAKARKETAARPCAPPTSSRFFKCKPWFGKPPLALAEILAMGKLHPITTSL